MKHGGGGINVYGCFSLSGVGPLVKVEGNMDAVMFKEILEKNMLPYAKKKMPRGWIYQMDNDPKHRSKLVTSWFEAKHVRVLQWPSQSPDLNPIEHLWDKLGKKVGIRTHKNKDNLFEDLLNEWGQISNTFIETLIRSMPKRCAAVIAAKGYPTKY